MTVETITSTQSWTCPDGVTSVDVECYGGGSASESVSGFGGGGGAYSKKLAVPVTPGNSYTITVGAGGVWASNTGGGDSWFKDTATVLAKGAASPPSQRRLGALASDGVGDTKFSGGDGVSAGQAGGGGGAGSAGNGGNASGTTGGTGGSGGGGAGGNFNAAGSIPGGGGGVNFGTGQNGARGQVVLTYFAVVGRPQSIPNNLAAHRAATI